MEEEEEEEEEEEVDEGKEVVVEVVVDELDNCDAVIVLVAWAEDRNTACVGSNP